MKPETSSSARRWWVNLRGVTALVLCMVAMDANALRKLDRGEEPRLGPDEGLLVVAVDSDTAVSSVRFRKVDSSWSQGVLSSIKDGRTTQMYVVPAGRYHWSKVTLIDNWSWSGSFDLSKDDEYAFEVKPAQITYAGDLVYRATGFLSASIRLSNRALPVIDWLQANHPAVYARLPFAYSGYYPDPFPAFYRDAQLQSQVSKSPTGLDTGRAAPKPGTLPLPPKVLWKPERVSDVALSPDGQLVAETIRESGDRWTINLIDIAAGTSQQVASSEIPFTDIRWESERILLATAWSNNGSWLHAIHVGDAVAGQRAIQRVPGPFAGTLVDLLPGEPGTVLYQVYNHSKKLLVVHRLQLDSKETVGRFSRASTHERLNQGVKDDLGWFADGHGRLRAAFAKRGEDDVVLMHGRDGQFREVMSYQSDNGFQPLKLSFEGDVFFGLTDEGRGQRDLVEFDPATAKVTRTLYSKPGVDLESVLFDDHRNPIGATYYEAGRLVSDYFDQANQRLGRMLRTAFAERTVAAIQRSRDAGRMLLWVDGSDLPTQLYLLDATARRADLLDETTELAGRTFTRAHVLKVHGSDGLPVEAFLTVPSVPGKRPVVVMPHGGPIGVKDDLHFNRDVQFLASLGYAVLQVNYRGSDGYGKAFREAGHRNYGKLIEDDIDAAIKAALASHPLDETRMCALGTSYGGYSAMLSTIRWPERFRCAVSIAGVSDRALFFTASDSGREASTRKEMEKVIGNPNADADLAEMQATSPLYRYRDLKVPVMLVHGGDDARVDYEHTRRLVRLLSMAGNPPVVMSFEKEGHGLEELENIDAAWQGIAGFLAEHLGPVPAPVTPVAATSPVAAQ